MPIEAPGLRVPAADKSGGRIRNAPTTPATTPNFILGDGLDYLRMVGTTLDEIEAEGFIV